MERGKFITGLKTFIEDLRSDLEDDYVPRVLRGGRELNPRASNSKHVHRDQHEGEHDHSAGNQERGGGADEPPHIPERQHEPGV